MQPLDYKDVRAQSPVMLSICELFSAKQSAIYCKVIKIHGYLNRQILPSGHIDSFLNWQSLVMFSMSLIKEVCIGGHLIWQFLGCNPI